MTTYSSMHRWLYFSARQSNLTWYLLATGSGCIHTVNSILWRCLIVLKLEWLGYHMVKKLWRYVKPFSSDTGTQRTDLLYKYHASVCWRAIKSNGMMGQMTGQLMTGQLAIRVSRHCVYDGTNVQWKIKHHQTKWNTTTFKLLYSHHICGEKTVCVQRPFYGGPLGHVWVPAGDWNSRSCA